MARARTVFAAALIAASAFVGAALVAAPTPALAQTATSLTGQWSFDVQTDQGSGSPTITLKQDGEKLSGKYTGQLGQADLTGTVKGNAFAFSFSLDVQGTTATVTYEGKIEGANAVSGTVDIGGAARGTFTGKRGA